MKKGTLSRSCVERNAPDVDGTPTPRRHDIELEWNGARHRFQMHVDDECLACDEISLVAVFCVNKRRDAWSPCPRTVLESARRDASLMGRLNTTVDALERSRADAAVLLDNDIAD